MIEFKKLHVGDRFVFELQDGSLTLWTKINNNEARHHSNNSIDLKQNSYGYIGDVIASFEDDDLVNFLPVNFHYLY